MRTSRLLPALIAVALTTGASASMVTPGGMLAPERTTPPAASIDFSNTSPSLEVIRTELTWDAGHFDLLAAGATFRLPEHDPFGVWTTPLTDIAPIGTQIAADRDLLRSGLPMPKASAGFNGLPPVTTLGKVPSTGTLHPLVIPTPGAMAMLAVSVIVAGTRRRTSS